jgi:hypothetical protein
MSPATSPPRSSAPQLHVVLGVALILSLPQIWNYLNNQATLTTTLLVFLAALIVSWAGCALVKAVVIHYMPPDTPEPAEPYELTGGPTYQPPAGSAPNGNGAGTPPTVSAPGNTPTTSFGFPSGRPSSVPPPDAGTPPSAANPGTGTAPAP